MADFAAAVPVIFVHEGGLADNPHDPGGITNFGITIPFFFDKVGGQVVWHDAVVQRYFGHPGPVGRADIRGLTKDLAGQIYLNEIWTPNRYGELADQYVGTKVFDTTVNMGEKRGEAFAQQAANRLGASLAVDGQLGSISMTVINALDPNALLTQYCLLQREAYEHIVLIHPGEAVFLKNWLARAQWPF
jgi:lysozyme family protein